MDEYDELADRAERGRLVGKPDTTRRGATGAPDVDEATRIALGRPRLGSRGASPVWRVRATEQLDQRVRALAAERRVPVSQVVRDAVAAYVK